MRLKTTREKRIFYFKTTLRWTIYYLLIFISFILMTSGSWLKPILLVPVALCISVNNDIMISAFTGAFCGILTDIACGRLLGFNAVVFMVFCVIITLIFELYLRKKFFNFIVIASFLEFIQCALDYKFFYDIWDYANVKLIFRNITVKVWLYTIASTIILYVIFKIVDHFLMPKQHLTIEEVIRTS